MTPLLVLVVIVLTIWLFRVSDRLGDLDRTISRLRREIEQLRAIRKEEARQPSAPTAKPDVVSAAPAEAKPLPAPQVVRPPETPPISQAPAPSNPPTSPPPPPRPPSPPRPSVPQIDWEQFMGVKGFAWIGGVALFLGIAFFVKYSFDNNLIPPALRVALGFIAGLGLLVGGAVLARGNYAVLSQTLSATGVVVLYAVTFACRALYHFDFFGTVPTFFLMALITATAFLLAVRQNALVVAILGMLAGFLTPVLLSTGQDNPFALFGYIAVLDFGLILVAMNRRWDYLSAAAAFGTALMQIGWVAKFFTAERYFEGNKILIAFAVLLGFNALYFGANWLSQRRGQMNGWLFGSNVALVGVALAFTAFFLGFSSLAERPALLFSFVFLIDLVVAALVYVKADALPVQPMAGLAVFGLLALWTAVSLRSELLNTALVVYLVFALFHSLLPVLLTRLRPSASAPPEWNQIFPPLAILLVFSPILRLAELSFLVWPFVLLVDLVAIALAALNRRLLPVLAVLVLSMAATGALILTVPSDLSGVATSFVLIGVFAVFFVIVAVWLISRFEPEALTGSLKLTADAGSPDPIDALLPFSSVVLPFLLLMMATLRLPLVNPSSVFGIALLVAVLLLGVTRIFTLHWLPLVGLVSVFALESTWSLRRFDPADPNATLIWHIVFYAVFAVFPFIFLRRFSDASPTWIAAALTGPAHFLLIYRLVKASWPNPVMGLLPAVFALPALASLFVVLKKISAGSRARMTQLAWFGGVALFFITLIFPVQFSREWITIGWALEGAALVWLFHRVPHPGLRFTGVVLLTAAFLRLALNPAVLAYHPRSTTPIFNWYLYTYAIVAAALFAGARLLASPRDRLAGINAQGLLASLGTVLSFLLLNIEIADYFSPPGSTLTFQFTGNFARDMTYSIAWALFALGLLVYGIRKAIAAVRYAAMALLLVTLIKLFLHDLASLGQPYRIVAFITVAVVAMLASFAYQRFFSAAAVRPETRK